MLFVLKVGRFVVQVEKIYVELLLKEIARFSIPFDTVVSRLSAQNSGESAPLLVTSPESRQMQGAGGLIISMALALPFRPALRRMVPDGAGRARSGSDRNRYIRAVARLSANSHAAKNRNSRWKNPVKCRAEVEELLTRAL